MTLHGVSPSPSSSLAAAMDSEARVTTMIPAVAKKDTVAAVFKTPTLPPPRKRPAKKILDEEDYTKDLEEIIERDFFPDLSKMKAQLEYREAVENNDVEKLRALRLKYGGSGRAKGKGQQEGHEEGTTSGQTHDSATYKSPATFETPVDLRNDSSADRLPPSMDDPREEDVEEENGRSISGGNKRVEGRGLDAYLSRMTSEDNASFGVMMEEAEEKHRQKYGWLFDKESEHAQMKEKALALPSAQEQMTDRHRPLPINTWHYTNRNSLMYVPEGAPLSEEERQDQILKQRSISHVNTRFQRMPFDEAVNRQVICAAAQLQARAKEGRIGVDGKEVVPKDEATVNGYGYVTMTPSPAPGVNETPLMTWGEIEGTPFRLDESPLVGGGGGGGGRTPGPSFRIPAVPARDRLALSLAEQVGKQHREKKQLALKAVKATLTSPSPNCSHVERLASMSPAAQRLASHRLGIHLGSDKTLRLSYTPSPNRKTQTTGLATPTSFQPTPEPSSSSTTTTPKSKRSTGGTTPSGGGHQQQQVLLTDDLLRIPSSSSSSSSSRKKRKAASDFFSPHIDHGQG